MSGASWARASLDFWAAPLSCSRSSEPTSGMSLSMMNLRSVMVVSSSRSDRYSNLPAHTDLPRGRSGKNSLRCHVHRGLERVVERPRFLVGKRQNLRQVNVTDAGRGVDPEVGIWQAHPT